MGNDAYCLLAYGCELTKKDLESLEKKFSCDFSEIFEIYLEKFNSTHNCKFDYHYSEHDFLIYVANPTHYAANRVSDVKTIMSDPTLTMAIDDHHLEAIKILKRKWPATNKEWAWKLMVTYN